MTDPDEEFEIERQPFCRKRAADLRLIGLSETGREYISVWFFDYATEACDADNDLIGRVAAVALQGGPMESARAAQQIETFIVSAVHEATKAAIEQGSVSTPKGARGAPTLEARAYAIERDCPEEYFPIIFGKVHQLVNRNEIKEWFAISMILAGGKFQPSTNRWIRAFFGLPKPHSEDGMGEVRSPQTRRVSLRKKQLDLNPLEDLPWREQVERSIIASCTPHQVAFIQTLVAFKRRFYHTAIETATTYLEHADEDDVCIRFARLICALQLGMRNLCIVDSGFLHRSSSEFISEIGQRIAKVVLPSEKVKCKTHYIADEEAEFAFAIGEWCRALILFQTGHSYSALHTCFAALPFVKLNDLREWICDVAFVSAISSSTPEKLASISLSPIRQLHLAFVRAATMATTPEAEIERLSQKSNNIIPLLEPKGIGSYTDARVLVAFNYLRAKGYMALRRPAEAWNAIVLAVEAAKEIMDSFEYCLSLCAPHRIIWEGISIALVYIEMLNPLDESGLDLSTKPVARNDPQEMKTVQILQTIRGWSNIIRKHCPRVRLGRVAKVLVSITARDRDSIRQAEQLCDAYPTSIHALNVMSLALYMMHLSFDATRNARLAVDMYPHVMDVRHMYRTVAGTVPLHTVLYRSVLPVSFSYGRQNIGSVRRAIMLTMMIVQFLFFAVFVAAALAKEFGWFDTLEDFCFGELTSPRVLIPFIVGVGVLLLSTIAALTSTGLISDVLRGNRFRTSAFNRFIFVCRGFPAVNVAMYAFVVIWGNGFGLKFAFNLIILSALVMVFLFPMCTRYFFLDSADQPEIDPSLWMSILMLDFATYPFTAPMHFFTVLLEPVLFPLQFLLGSRIFTKREDDKDFYETLQRFEMLHSKPAANQKVKRDATRTFRFQFYHALLRAAYWKTHSDCDTRYSLHEQMAEDDRRVFPLSSLDVSFVDVIQQAEPPKRHNVPVLTKIHKHHFVGSFDEERRKTPEAHTVDHPAPKAAPEKTPRPSSEQSVQYDENGVEIISLQSLTHALQKTWGTFTQRGSILPEQANLLKAEQQKEQPATAGSFHEWFFSGEPSGTEARSQSVSVSKGDDPPTAFAAIFDTVHRRSMPGANEDNEVDQLSLSGSTQQKSMPADGSFGAMIESANPGTNPLLARVPTNVPRAESDQEGSTSREEIQAVAVPETVCQALMRMVHAIQAAIDAAEGDFTSMLAQRNYRSTVQEARDEFDQRRMKNVSDFGTITLESTQDGDEVVALIDSLLGLDDTESANVDLLTFFFTEVTGVSYSAAAAKKKWLSCCVDDSKPKYFDLLMTYVPKLPEAFLKLGPNSRLVQSMLISNSDVRARFFLTVLLSVTDLPMYGARAATFATLWQSVFDLTAIERSENLSGITQSAIDRTRWELLILLNDCEDITLDYERESHLDNHNALTRAAFSGDMKLIISIQRRDGELDWNRPISDRTTPMIHAIRGNHVVIVEYLLQQCKVDLNYCVPGQGTALQIARKIHADPRIISALQFEVDNAAGNL